MSHTETGLATAPATMRAVVVTRPGGLDALEAKNVPVPERKPGWVRIAVKAFGVNESEVSTRKGESDPEVTYPRVPGIEAVGVVDEADAASGLRPGQQVATMMGGMGRTFDGSYAQYVTVPAPQAIGVDHPIVDDGTIAQQVRGLVPDGVDAALELVGATVLADTLRSVRTHGTVCFTGAVADGWTIPEFSPFMIPSGVRLTSYAGAATDLSSHVFQQQLQAIADGRLKAPIAKSYRGLDRVRDAQAGVEDATAPGKHVVLLDD